MNITKYKEILNDMCFDNELDFGFVSGNPYKFYIKSNDYRITWNKKENTVTLPSMSNNEEITKNASNTTNPPQLLDILKGNVKTSLEYYIPISKEDEFQASTARIGNILPYELVESLERLLIIASECISQYSIDARKYK